MRSCAAVCHQTCPKCKRSCIGLVVGLNVCSGCADGGGQRWTIVKEK